MAPLFFTQDAQGVWESAKPQQDLLVAYVLVLVMLACDGRLQAEVLAELRTVRPCTVHILLSYAVYSCCAWLVCTAVFRH